MTDALDIQNAFLGKPFDKKLKIGGKEYDFKFEQLELEDLPDFVEVLNLLQKSEGQMTKDITAKCLPLVKRMMELSYPDGHQNWNAEFRKKFIKANLFVLNDIMFEINMKTLTAPILEQKSKEELDSFIKEQRKKIKDGKRPNPVEPKASK